MNSAPDQADNHANSGQAAKRRKGKLRRVGELALPVLKPVLQRRTGMTIDLIAAWPAIVGAKHAEYTLPEKINWPRRAHEDDPFQPATLIIACEDARAVFFQHETCWILERVNTFFGFQAIARIKLAQKPLHRLHKDREQGNRQVELDAESAARLEKMLQNITDPELKARLEKLGRGVLARKNQTGKRQAESR